MKLNWILLSLINLKDIQRKKYYPILVYRDIYNNLVNSMEIKKGKLMTLSVVTIHLG